MAEVRRFELSAWNAIVGLGTGERFVRASDYDALAAELDEWHKRAIAAEAGLERAVKYSYDTECHNLAIHFFGERDPRLAEIAQAIQDTVEQFPELSICDGCGKPLRDHHKPLMTCNPTTVDRGGKSGV